MAIISKSLEQTIGLYHEAEVCPSARITVNVDSFSDPATGIFGFYITGPSGATQNANIDLSTSAGSLESYAHSRPDIDSEDITITSTSGSAGTLASDDFIIILKGDYLTSNYNDLSAIHLALSPSSDPDAYLIWDETLTSSGECVSSKSTNHYSINQSLSLTDHGTTPRSYSGSNTISFTHSTEGITLEHELTQSLSLTQEVEQTSHNRHLEQSLSLTQTVNTTQSKSITDNLSLTQSVHALWDQDLEQNLLLIQEVTQTGLTQTADNFFGLSHTVSETKILPRTITQSLDLDQTGSIKYPIKRTIEQTLSLTQDPHSNLIKEDLEQSLGITQVLAYVGPRPASAEHTIEMTHITDYNIIRVYDINDCLDFHDHAAPVTEETLTQSLTLTDSAVKAKYEHVEQSLSLTESVEATNYSVVPVVDDDCDDVVNPLVKDTLELTDSVSLGQIKAIDITQSLDLKSTGSPFILS